MVRKAFSISVFFIGVFLFYYGVVRAPVSNQSEILSNYACDRITKEVRNTDVYCSNPKDAPEVRKNLSNIYSYTGATLIVIAGIYFVIDLKYHRD